MPRKEVQRLQKEIQRIHEEVLVPPLHLYKGFEAEGIKGQIIVLFEHVYQ